MDADREHLWNLFKRLKENKNMYIMVYNISDDIISILIKKLKKISLKKDKTLLALKKYIFFFMRVLLMRLPLYIFLFFF